MPIHGSMAKSGYLLLFLVDESITVFVKSGTQYNHGSISICEITPVYTIQP